MLSCAFRFSSHKAEHDASHIVHHDVSEAPKVPHEIYKGMLTKQVRAVKTFSLGTSLIGLGMQPVLYEVWSVLIESGVLQLSLIFWRYQHISNSENSVTILVALSSVVGFFTFFTPFLIHYVTKKYVTEIVYDPSKDEYTATTLSLLLTRKKVLVWSY